MKNGEELVAELEDTDTSSTNPALTASAVVAALYGITYVVLRQFVPDLSDAVINNWYAALTPVLLLVVGWFIRQKVWSPNSVQKVVNTSVRNALESSSTSLPQRNREPVIKPDEFPPAFGNKNI